MLVIWTLEDTSTKRLHDCTLRVSIPHSGNLHLLSGKTSTFSTFTDLFIYSQSARDLELYKGIQITRDTISPSNHVHITLIEQVGYWVHIRIYFFDKKNSRCHHSQTL